MTLIEVNFRKPFVLRKKYNGRKAMNVELPAELFVVRKLTIDSSEGNLNHEINLNEIDNS